MLIDSFHRLHSIYVGDTYAPHLSIDQHFASSAFADTTLKTARTTLEAVAVDGISCLMQGCCNGFSTLSTYGFPFKLKLYDIVVGDVDYGMSCDAIHWKMDFTTEKKFYTTRVEGGLTGYCASLSTRAEVFICSYRGFLSCVYLSVRLSRGSILR